MAVVVGDDPTTNKTTFFPEDTSVLVSTSTTPVLMMTTTTTPTPITTKLMKQKRVSDVFRQCKPDGDGRAFVELLKSKWAASETAKRESFRRLETQNSLAGMMKATPNIATIRKERVFAGDITEEDQNIIERRVAWMQKQNEEQQRRMRARQVAKIRSMNECVTEQEALRALEKSNGEEDEAAVKVLDSTFLYEIRREIAKEAQTTLVPRMETAEEQAARERMEARRKRTASCSSRKARGDTNYVYVRLTLNEALKRTDTFEGWSPARIRAWQDREKNPNAYYYRFNEPGEEQRNGQWLEHEERLFFKRCNELYGPGELPNGQWGIFSQTIPGRVGYQCSNFYRALIKCGRVVDPSYFLDERGNVHYIFKKGGVARTKRNEDLGVAGLQRARANGEAMPHATVVRSERQPEQKNAVRRRGRGKTYPKQKGRMTKKRRAIGFDPSADVSSSDDEMFLDDNDGEFRPAWKGKRRDGSSSGGGGGGGGGGSEEEATRDEGPVFDASNPIPDCVDPITLDPVVKPAISPSGHVMGYDSWIRCLNQEPKNVCPFTKQALERRELVRLTHDNIDKYREKIVGLV
eukprot:TRINITY_DN21317_c0_g1_i4.p1 TRINITY_DN21317_c0_g1~~TRINITY_DN21317_c0_g1_i4.p1  ORF type:complete len:609 (+),score=130.18 TRINITY_DN21317_c0_g1_i4:95-1828(+)